MGDTVEHNCSISVTRTLADAYDFLKAQDHRGPDAAGIGALRTDGLIDVVTWVGSVSRFDIDGLRILFPNEYTFFFSHGRYATRGSDVPLLEEAHPIVIGGKRYPETLDGTEDHRVIRGASAAIVHNGQVSDLGVDRGRLATNVDSEQLLEYYRAHGPERTMRGVPLAYTAVFIDAAHGGVRVLRDRTGIKPGVLGIKDGCAVIASEDVAIRKNHGRVAENLAPGTIYELEADGSYTTKKGVEPTPRRCFFEWMYISHLDSVLDDRSVRSVREPLGRVLAEEIAPSDIDLVTFLPRSPQTAARAYARARGLEFAEVFYKVNKQRSFLAPSQKKREASIQQNLRILPEWRDGLAGKTILVVDDSIVRGTNSRYVGKLLSETGVRRAYLASCTPRIGIIGDDGVARGCEYGVDMPPDGTFIARDDRTGTNRSEREISDIVGLDVRYLSVDGLRRAYSNAGIEASTLCTFCIGGPRPDADL